MNSEFQKRQAEVFEALSILAPEAKAAGETLIFIGGSAIQTAVLKETRRLSIDLDLYYSGNAEVLLSKLIGYKVEKRLAKQQDLFSFYNVFKGEIQVKVDIAHFSLVNTGKPFELKKFAVGKKFFEANVATPDYLLASKLAALAIGTVGRSPEKEGFKLDFLKDAFDANCLIDDFSAGSQTWKYFEQVRQVQNKVRNTNFNFRQVAESAANALLESIVSNKPTSLGKSHLNEFQNAYLQTGTISTPAYWTMACRLAAYLGIVNENGTGEASKTIEKMEKIVAEKYGNKQIVDTYEAKLIENGFDQKQLHELKVTAPRALIYLFIAKYPSQMNELKQ